MRARHVGYESSNFTYYGSIYGQADDVPPLVFLHRRENGNPWVAYINAKDEHEHKVVRPPFSFLTYVTREAPVECFSHPESAPFLHIPEPDLELHQHAIDTGDGDESDKVSSDSEDEQDSQRYTGWSGDWTREFIRRAADGEPLGSLEKEVWTDDKALNIEE